MPDWEPLLRHPVWYWRGSHGQSLPNSHRRPVSYAAENTKSHHTWGRYYQLEFAMGHPAGWMNYFVPLCDQEPLYLYWDPIVLLQAGPVKCAVPGRKHRPLKEGRK